MQVDDLDIEISDEKSFSSMGDEDNQNQVEGSMNQQQKESLQELGIFNVYSKNNYLTKNAADQLVSTRINEDDNFDSNTFTNQDDDTNKIISIYSKSPTSQMMGSRGFFVDQIETKKDMDSGQILQEPEEYEMRTDQKSKLEVLENEFLNISQVSPIEKSNFSKLDERSLLLNKHEVQMIFADRIQESSEKRKPSLGRAVSPDRNNKRDNEQGQKQQSDKKILISTPKSTAEKFFSPKNTKSSFVSPQNQDKRPIITFKNQRKDPIPHLFQVQSPVQAQKDASSKIVANQDKKQVSCFTQNDEQDPIIHQQRPNTQHHNNTNNPLLNQNQQNLNVSPQFKVKRKIVNNDVDDQNRLIKLSDSRKQVETKRATSKEIQSSSIANSHQSNQTVSQKANKINVIQQGENTKTQRKPSANPLVDKATGSQSKQAGMSDNILTFDLFEMQKNLKKEKMNKLRSSSLKNIEKDKNCEKSPQTSNQEGVLKRENLSNRQTGIEYQNPNQEKEAGQGVQQFQIDRTNSDLNIGIAHVGSQESQNRANNHGIWINLFEDSILKKQEKGQREKEAQQKEEDQLKENCTFKPQINNYYSINFNQQQLETFQEHSNEWGQQRQQFLQDKKLKNKSCIDVHQDNDLSEPLEKKLKHHSTVYFEKLNKQSCTVPSMILEDEENSTEFYHQKEKQKSLYLEEGSKSPFKSREMQPKMENQLTKTQECELENELPTNMKSSMSIINLNTGNSSKVSDILNVFLQQVEEKKGDQMDSRISGNGHLSGDLYQQNIIRENTIFEGISSGKKRSLRLQNQQDQQVSIKINNSITNSQLSPHQSIIQGIQSNSAISNENKSLITVNQKISNRPSYLERKESKDSKQNRVAQINSINLQKISSQNIKFQQVEDHYINLQDLRQNEVSKNPSSASTNSRPSFTQSYLKLNQTQSNKEEHPEVILMDTEDLKKANHTASQKIIQKTPFYSQNLLKKYENLIMFAQEQQIQLQGIRTHNTMLKEQINLIKNQQQSN